MNNKHLIFVKLSKEKLGTLLLFCTSIIVDKIKAILGITECLATQSIIHVQSQITSLSLSLQF